MHDSLSSSSSLGLICHSARMRELSADVERAAAMPGGVLLAGEPGTGRGLVARTIHAVAHEQGAPFVAVYCDKANHSTLEMELFGTAAPHRPNPMPGSGVRPRTGPEHVAVGSLLHRARGGTIYIAHAEMLPDRVQARLVQILDEGVALIGAGIEPEPCRVRPMTALDPRFLSDRDEDRIRPDLFKRLSAITVKVPALRERREDIPDLSGYFLARACRQRGLAEKKLAPEVLAVLGALPWQGNARELNDLIDALVLGSNDGDVGIDALMRHLRLEHPNSGETAPSPKSHGATLRQARMQFEREYISNVLARHRGRIPDAARALGIQRTNLYRKLRLLQIGKVRAAASAEQ